MLIKRLQTDSGCRYALIINPLLVLIASMAMIATLPRLCSSILVNLASIHSIRIFGSVHTPDSSLRSITVERYLQRALGWNSQDFRAYYMLGLLQNYRGDNESAAKALSHALSIRYREIIPWFVRSGDRFASSGALEKAEREYELALLLQPNNVDVLVRLGNTLYNQGEQTRAEAVYWSAINLLSQDQALRFGLEGQIHIWNRDWAKALLSYERAVALDPNNAAWHTTYALALSKTKGEEEAILYLKAQIREETQWVWGFKLLFQLLLNEGHCDDAAFQWRKAVDRGLLLTEDVQWATRKIQECYAREN